MYPSSFLHLHLIAPAGGAEVLAPGHLRREPDAARAVDAARHHRLDQRAQVLVLHGALAKQVVVRVPGGGKRRREKSMIVDSSSIGISNAPSQGVFAKIIIRAREESKNVKTGLCSMTRNIKKGMKSTVQ